MCAGSAQELWYLLGALCGFFREVVVGVVSLCDATEQHSHHACKTYKHIQEPEVRVH